MNAIRSAESLGALILGLSLITAVCQANSADKSTAFDSDVSGSYSATALYDLGNSYARDGKPALAVLNYERARLLAPQDPDIQANLQHVRDVSSLSAEPLGSAGHLRLLSPNATYWWGIAGLMTAGIAGLLLALEKTPPLVLKASLGAGLLLVVFALSDATSTAHLMREAVVMQSTTASASPIVTADTLFSLDPAAFVTIQDEHGNFYLVRDSHNNIGWVPRSHITPVINPEGDFHA